MMCCFLRAPVFFVCVRQIGESGGETEGMGTQKSVGGGRAAGLLHGAVSGPGAENGPKPCQQHTTRCQWQQCQRVFKVCLPPELLPCI